MAENPEPGWSIRTVGPLVLRRGSEPVELRPKERAVLAALALRHPRPSTAGQLAPLIWDPAPPASAHQSIQNHVARIRRVAGGVVVTSPDGYLLAGDVVIDDITGPPDAVPFADLPSTPELDTERLVRSRRILDAEDLRLASMLDEPGTEHTIDDLHQAATRAPDRERRWLLLMLAQARAGRRREAMLTATEARRHLGEFGLAPSRRLQDLERRILDDDPTIASRHTGTSADATGVDTVIGLDDHLALFERLLDGTDPRRVIFLTGPAGAGKTTAAHAMGDLGRRRGWSVAWATCSPHPTVPLEPFATLLTEIRERDPEHFDQAPDADALAGMFPHLPRARSDTAVTADRSAVFDIIADRLVRSVRPRVVVVEDTHWASPVTMHMLAQVIETLHNRPAEQAPVVLVCTSRDDHVDHLIGAGDEAAPLRLEPWDASTVDQYLARFSGDDDWVKPAADWIFRQSGGHPLFVRELAIVVSARSTPDGSFVAPTTLPAAVRGAIEQRLRYLSPAARRVLEAGAIHGVEFRAGDVVQMLGPVTPGLEEAIAARIVTADTHSGELRFQHELFHSAILDALPTGTTVELHDLAARAIDGHGDRTARLAEFARHAAASAVLDRPRAIDALLESARAHADGYAWEEAADEFADALDLIEQSNGLDARWCAVSIECGRVMMKAGDDHSLTHLYAAADVAADLADEVLLAAAVAETYRLGPTSAVGGIDPRAVGHLEQALAVVQNRDQRARVCAAGAMLYGVTDAARASELFDEAASLLDGRSDDELTMEVLPLAVVAIAGPEDLGRREAIVEQLRAVADRTGRPEHRWGQLHLQMSNQIQRGDPALRVTHRELTELAGTLRARSRSFEHRFWSCATDIIDGDLEGAERQADRILEFLGEIAESRVMAIYGGSLLAIRFCQGRIGELDATVAQLAAEQPEIGAWHAVHALTSASTGCPETAIRSLELVLADDEFLQRDSTFTAAAVSIGEAAAIVGQADHRDAANRLLLPWRGRWSYSGAGTFGPIDLTLARLALASHDSSAARQFAHDAAAAADRLNAPLFAEHASLILDQTT